MKKNIIREIRESIATKKDIIGNGVEKIEQTAKICIDSLKGGGKILWCGNGGSAADAQHLATELMGGMSDHNRKPIQSIALTTDTSFITAWSNDTSFDSIFSRQVQGIGSEGDVLIGISTSGNSKNIIEAIKQAKYKKLNTVVFSGESGGIIDGLADVTIKIPSKNTQRIQESHIMVGQIICGLIEKSLM